MNEEGGKRLAPSWWPVDLAALLASPEDPPRPEVGAVDGSEFGLFYPGRINAVFGDSGGGKSWLLASCIADVLKSGRDAVLVDYEDFPQAFVSRLQQLGVGDDAIVRHLLYFNPTEVWNGLSERVLSEVLSGRDVAVAVLDSTGEAMAVDGVNPNSDEEVARWFRGAGRFLADTGAAVVLVDHTVKSLEYSRNKDFASGSQRKRAAINGAAYYLEVVVAPSRDSDGKLKLLVRKCRYGWRKHGTVACEIDMANRDGGRVDMRVFVPAGQPVTESGLVRRTWYMERISEVVEGSPDISVSKLIEEVRRVKSSASDKWVREAVKVLVEEKFLSQTDHGPGKAKSLLSLRPYREVEDPASNKFDADATASFDPF